MTMHWRNVVLAWLYDPPDTVLNRQGIRTRAASYASAALGAPIDEAELDSVRAQYTSLEEHLPRPQGSAQTLAMCQVDFLTESEAHARRLAHPLSGAVLQLPLGRPEEYAPQQIAAIIADLTQSCTRCRLIFYNIPA